MLSVRNISAQYRGTGTAPVQAARNISFEVAKGKLFTLLGPSGCGKTTTLRSIAGLERPVAGEIQAGGRVMFSAHRNIFVALNRRNFGMVFQSYAIWPHMTVLKNASFPLEVRGGLSPQAIRDRAMRVLDAMGLGEFAEREATKLSGGQQQRLALARALVMEPDLLLLDEPLSNLDARLRERMRLELKRLQRELSITTVYVTHDQSEALALSHEIAVMNAGRIVQTGSPQSIYDRPRDRFVAGFIGSSNFIDGEVLGPAGEPGMWRIRSSVGDISAASEPRLAPGAKVSVLVRPENIETVAAGEGGENVIAARVTGRLFQGEFSEFQFTAGNLVLAGRMHPSFRASQGESVQVRLRPKACVVLTASGPSSPP